MMQELSVKVIYFHILSNFMNNEFKITNPNDIPPGESWTINQDDLRKIQEQNEILIEIRGRIISSSLNIEHKLDDIISVLFMGNELDSINLFKELLLEKEFFTFMNKWKLLRELTQREIIRFEKEEVRKETLSLVKNIIETRDRFAHGEIIFSGTTPQLIYLDGGKKKRVTLDNKYFDDQNVKFVQADNILRDIYNFFLNRNVQQEDKESFE